MLSEEFRTALLGVAARGTLQFRIPADALARGDYSAVTAMPSSS